MKFQDVIGQKSLLQELKSMVDTDTLPHAFFLKGESGYGPLAVGVAIAAYVLTKKEERVNLEVSSSYQKAINFIHPDLNFAFPVVAHKSKKRKDTTSRDFISEWRNALKTQPYLNDSDWIMAITNTTSVGNMNVAECNNIISNLTLKPFESDHKVQIIWMPQYLAKEGNRLLKIIEEPPAGTHIIFIGDDTEKVLSTITSRCQIISVPRIDDQSITEALVKNHGESQESAQRISFLADGNYGKAVALLSLDESLSFEMVAQWVSAAYSGSALTIRNWVASFNDLGKEEQKSTLIYLLKTLRELVRLKLLGPEHCKLVEEERKLIENNVILNNLTIPHIGDITDVVNDTYVLLERNANPRILMFQKSLEIGKIIKSA